MKEYEVAILSSTMTDEQEEYAAKTASEAIVMDVEWSNIAYFIKRSFDRKYENTWQCVVGKNFCGSFTHETGDFIHFKLEDLTFLLFRSVKKTSQMLTVDSSRN
ncbi:Dynein light chain [Schistosoma japonicum]|uniref:Dynein light chain n=1 Tax=Schistosoma japonicum TaxID=6182 RepID=A0A4Z2D612_SCHJA|nr:Dynein light chain [Schistosoma japonicum]